MWLDFAIMSIEQLLNVLRTIRAAYREHAPAAAVELNGENEPIKSNAVEDT